MALFGARVVPDVKLTIATEESWGGSGVSLSAGFIKAGAVLLPFSSFAELDSSDQGQARKS